MEFVETKNHLPLELDCLTSEMEEKAKKELGETEEVRNESLEQLKKLVKDEENLVCPLDDKYLLQFLRARKFDVKRAFDLLLSYYYTKAHYPEVYKSDFAGFRRSIERMVFSILPHRCEDGAAIIVIKLGNWNYNERSMESMIHDFTIVISYVLQYPASQVCGMKIIWDMKSLSPAYLKAINPKYLILMANGARNCLPMRLKEVHVINEPFIFKYVWNILKYMLGEKLRNRVHFHGNNSDNLLRYIPPELYPVECGGNLEYDAKKILNSFDSKIDEYEEFMSYGYVS